MVLKTEANEKSIEEIEKKLAIVGGDMLKIEYLENSLKKDLPMEVRKYVHIKLSDLYVKRLMIGVAAKNMEGAAEVAQSFKEKKELYMKQVNLLVKNLSFDEAEKALKKALTCANTSMEKSDIKTSYKNMFMQKAQELEKIQNMKKASEVYEKILALENNLEIKKRLAQIYNRIGKIKEAIALEQSMKNPKLAVQQEPVKKEFDIDEFLNS